MGDNPNDRTFREVFCDTLLSEMDKKFGHNNWSNANLVIKGFNDRSVSDWLTGKCLPNYESLVKLARFFEVPIDWLLTGKMPLYDAPPPPPEVGIFKSEGHYRNYRSKFIEEAKRSVWMQARIMPTLDQFFEEFSDLLRRGGRVRFIVSDPEDMATVTMLKRRGFENSWGEDEAEIQEELHKTLRILKKLTKRAEVTDERVEITTVRYFPSTVMYLADAEDDSGNLSDDGKAIVMTANLGQHYCFSPYVIANRRDHKHLFDTYYGEFNALLNIGKRVWPQNVSD